MKRPLLALEEHYYSSAIYSSLNEEFVRVLKAVPDLTEQLLDVGEKRLANMDAGSVAFQVVSHAFTPGGPCTRDCQRGNDELAHAVRRVSQPTRFASFAVLPVADAAACAAELNRCVKQLGFVGALIDNHADGQHFDSAEYDALWTAATELDVPIYLHPTFPSARMAEAFAGASSSSYSKAAAASLGAAGWGWHSDVGLHVLKLFAAGVFDRFPTLKLILGHVGEMLPFMLERCDDMSRRWAGWGPRQRPLLQVWRENVWITTSGAWSLAPIKCVLENTAVDRIMYSVDYPFESNEKGRAWFESLEASGLLTDDQLDMVAYRNAEQLLKVRVVHD